MSTANRISILDLDALREAFMKSIREQNVKDTDWGEHARLFIQQIRRWRDENPSDFSDGHP